MEFLQNNWVWLLLGVGAVWFLFRGGGCGMGGHGSHGSRGAEDPGRAPGSRVGHDGHDGAAAGDGRGRDEEQVATRGHRGHRGC